MKRKYMQRFIIVPFLIISVFTSTVYYNYITSFAFAAEATALEWFIQVLANTGYGIATRDQAEEACSSFSAYIKDEIEFFMDETLPGMVGIAVDNNDLSISVSQANMQMWNGVFNKNQTLAESKFQTLGLHQISMDSLASDNRVATGSYSALTVLTRGWLTQLVKDGHAPSWLDTDVGAELAVKVPVKLEETPFYQYAMSDDFSNYMHAYSGIAIDNIKAGVNTYFANLTMGDIERLASLGNKFYLGIENDANLNTLSLIYKDVPDSANLIKYERCSFSFGDIDYLHFYRDDVKLADVDFDRRINDNYTAKTSPLVGNWPYHRAIHCFLPVGFSSSAARDDYIPIDILDPAYVPNAATLNIDNLWANLHVTPISSSSYGMIRTGTTESADTMNLAIPDSAVKPNTAEEVIDKTAAGDYAGVTDMTDSAVDSDVANPAIDLPVAVPESGGYTLSLVDFFPFCIPFDLYKFLACLAADPVAPSIHYEFPLLGETYSIDADLSVFDSVAKVMRTMETLAFCVGLVILTNKLIKH